jgi:hypothetical protein
VLSVRYNDRGFIRTQFLVYTPAMTQNPFTAGALSYTFTQRLLTLALTSTYYIRWTRPNGYQILPPYGDLPNDPWFPRVGFNINPWAPEWARQLFNPQPPFLLATWVPGKVLSPSIIEFERKRVFFAGGHYPDVLVFDKDYNLKYALAGAQGKGLLYNWKYHQFVAIDPFLARVQVAVTLDPADICYGFYCYQEPDIVYTNLDVNPFTNQNVRNRIVQFYYKPHSLDPFRTIFYQILNNDGTVFLTNDPDPGYPTGGLRRHLRIDGSRHFARRCRALRQLTSATAAAGWRGNGRTSPKPSTSGIWARSTASPIPWAGPGGLSALHLVSCVSRYALPCSVGWAEHNKT